MNEKILDLDKLIPPAKIVIINGKEYKVKSDISVKEALELTKYASDLQSEKAVATLLNIIESFFIDSIDRAELEKIGLKNQLPKLIAFFFGKDADEGGAAVEKKTE
jgi:hypothetical protein